MQRHIDFIITTQSDEFKTYLQKYDKTHIMIHIHQIFSPTSLYCTSGVTHPPLLHFIEIYAKAMLLVERDEGYSSYKTFCNAHLALWCVSQKWNHYRSVYDCERQFFSELCGFCCKKLINEETGACYIYNDLQRIPDGMLYETLPEPSYYL